jgi:hypothetical protein
MAARWMRFSEMAAAALLLLLLPSPSHCPLLVAGATA